MATELETRTDTKTQTQRSIFTGINGQFGSSEYKRPAFKEIDFDDVTEFTAPTITTIEQQRTEKVMPQIQTTAAVQTQTQSRENVRAKLNARGKIILSVVAIVLCSLMAFAIGNAVTLSSLGGAISQKQQLVATQQQAVSQLEQEYQLLNSGVVDAAEELGYTQATEDQIIYLNSVETISRPTAQIETNWFDSLCKFFSNLFK